MEKVVHKYQSHAEAERADQAYYQSLSPAERLEILLKLVEQHGGNGNGASKGLERVYRVIELSSG